MTEKILPDTAEPIKDAATTAAHTSAKPRYDRAIVEGPLGRAVWKLA